MSRPDIWADDSVAVYVGLVHVLVPFMVLSMSGLLQGLDVRLDAFPLPVPVVPNGSMAVHVAAVHAVGPVHRLRQQRQHGGDVALVKAPVEAAHRRFIVGHVTLLPTARAFPAARAFI